MSKNRQSQDDKHSLLKTNPFLEPAIAGAAELINAIPIFGPIISVPISGGMVAWQNHNLNKLIESLQQKITALDNSKVDQIFLKSDEFISLIIQAVDAAMKTSSESRCDALANALLCSVVPPTSLYIGKQSLIRVLAQISDEEMLVLKILYEEEIDFDKNQGQPGEKAIPLVSIAEIAAKLKWEYLDALVACQALMQLGLAYDPLVGSWNRITEYDLTDEPASFRIKLLGCRVIQYALGAY